MWIYCKETTETGFNLSTHLKDCESGPNIPRDNVDLNDFIINYGKYTSRADLNRNIVTDKLEQLRIMRNAGVSVPPFYIIRNMATLRSREIPEDWYPLMARKVKHTKGKDIVICINRARLKWRIRRVRKRHFFTKFIDKVGEYRVHVLGEDIAAISQKVKYADVRRDEEEDEEGAPHEYIPLQASKYIWARRKGWVQVDYEGEHSEALANLAKRACRACGFDFGAVDIILGRDGRFYVLEINSAPRLNRRRRKIYTKYFRNKWKEKFKDSNPDKLRALKQKIREGRNNYE